MDDIIEAVVEIVGTIIEGIFDNIKNPKKRKWALTAFYALISIAVVGVFLWLTISYANQGMKTVAVVLGCISGALFAGFSFGIIRGHRRGWKRK